MYNLALDVLKRIGTSSRACHEGAQKYANSKTNANYGKIEDGTNLL